MAVPMKRPQTNLPDESPSKAILEAAGLHPDQIAHLLSQAIQTAQNSLYANVTKLVTHQGMITDQVDLVDNKTRLEAAKVLMDFSVKVAGLQAKSDNGPKQSPTVIVNIPSVPTNIKENAPRPVTITDDGADDDYLG